MHSATKYLNGHSDVVAGALATAVEDDFWARIKRGRSMRGQILGPFEAFLLIRGMRTLALRVPAACANRAGAGTAPVQPRRHRAGAVPRPARSSRPRASPHGRCRAASAACFPSASAPARRPPSPTAARTTLWKRATSLGGVESLIEHRGSIEGPGSPCPLDLLRLSAGIEDVEDLYADLDQAMTGA